MRSAKAVGIAALTGAVTTLAVITPAAGAATTARLPGPHRDGEVAAQVNYGQIAANAVAQGMASVIAAKRLAGFAGEQVNPSPTHPELTIYWHGQVPVMLRQAAAGYVTSRAVGVAVSFRPAPYTRARLLSLQRAINNVAGFWHLGIGAMGFYPQATGFWIEVQGQGSCEDRRW